MELIWSHQAEHDLDGVVSYIAQNNVQAALAMDMLLVEAAESLLLFPAKGRPGLVPGTRELVAHEHYVLVYQRTEEAVIIAAVLHTSRQWPPA
ncbi:type II toxin-antitoxin system RelE/ParE family toxin [Desulfovibrio cuneatus]|uniref:type II toxin-antitoxin system RelE/ParE family toxin n=1 Tax=Desulfovibrio cuneatus TaxID=159728 RepID=UPI000482F7CE